MTLKTQMTTDLGAVFYNGDEHATEIPTRPRRGARRRSSPS